jgi:type IV pilus assembly protein PilC
MTASDHQPDQSPPLPSGGKPLSSNDAAELVAGIAQLGGSGLPLVEGLKSLAEDVPSKALRKVYHDLAARLEAGVSLEAALDELGERAPAHLGGLVAAGVQAGRLGDVLLQVARAQDRARRLRRQVWQSVSYPLVLFALLLGVVLVVRTWVVESISDLSYESYADYVSLVKRRGSSDVPNPNLPLRLLLQMPSVMNPAFLGFLAGLLVLVLGFRRLTAEAFRHRLLASLPVVGMIWRYSSLNELLKLMAILLEQQVPLPRVLDLAAAGLRDRDLALSCQRLRTAVEAGHSLAESIHAQRRLPRSLAPLLEWGQRSGTLTDVLRSTADLYAQKAEVQANLARTILPPLMFLVILAGVGFVCYAMYYPLMQVIEALSF